MGTNKMSNSRLTRRSLMKAGVAASPLAILAAARIAQARRGRKGRKKKRGGKTSSAQTTASGGVKFIPFTQDLPIPEVLTM